jgi:hypothetical protein
MDELEKLAKKIERLEWRVTDTQKRLDSISHSEDRGFFIEEEVDHYKAPILQRAAKGSGSLQKKDLATTPILFYLLVLAGFMVLGAELARLFGH